MPSPEHDSNLRVAVLAGGESPEREVSLRSGRSAAAALATVGHSAALVDPVEVRLADVPWSDFDACLVALHGGAGEDGSLQRELERLGVPYTGSGPQACRLAMSKSASKRRFAAHDVPTPAWEIFADDDPPAEVARRVAHLGYPLVVKPDAQGSSIGVAIADDCVDLPRALAEARTFGGPCLAERLVAGREFTVAVLDDVALPTIEIVSPERVFSYDAKYHSSLTEYRFDFQLSAAGRQAIHDAAVGAARALGTSGLARVDLMLEHDGRVWVLEVNAIPGMTVRSLAPLAAARAGIDMPELCEMLVRRCLAAAGAW
jgi:D-alanine-D-alanine ligase